MLQKWLQWNRKATWVLCVLTILGVISAVPIGAERWKVENTSKHVEFVLDYRDLLQVAAYKVHPQQYIHDELKNIKAAGINSMAVFETSLQELSWAGHLSLYSSTGVMQLQGKPLNDDENYTYILFASEKDDAALRPVIEATFRKWNIPISSWEYAGSKGIVLETPIEEAMLKAMEPDQSALEMIKDAGLNIVPRLSDRIPFDAAEVDKMMASYEAMGVDRILFDGDAVKGYADNAELHSINAFADILNKHGIGIVTIENSNPQKGLATLSHLTHYNVVRLLSLSDASAYSMKPEEITDRFHLAAKDRSIRMFYINVSPISKAAKSIITDPMQNIYDAMQNKDGILDKMDDLGLTVDRAQPFTYDSPAWHKPFKAITALGAIAIIALLVSAYIPGSAIPVFAIGLVGSAGLYVLSKSMFEQGLALGAAISAPTLAVIWAIRRVRAHTIGNRRAVSGTVDNARNNDGGMRWIFPGLTAGRRFTMALTLFVMTSIISLCGIAFIIGLLNNITYQLVLEQFRGVSLLHLAPIALVAIYLFLYTGESVVGNIRKLLSMQITVLWVAVAAVLGVMALYYLSRTGNAGTASSAELMFRNVLENTFGVRPRTKEFLLAHPLFFLGLFLALRYRAAWVLFIVGTIGQLSMVDTFAHIHTPIPISLIRDVLGLVLGLIIGLVLIGIWQVGEGVWKRWAPRIAQMKQGYKSGV
ncbi:DUF5693 family protein [Paenibacillus sp. OV219]|uniref:DUF5693 family protein n=1 Tax=Paenibacillus sp. OV219 TaxID=1884377 RepID=UPI0008B3456F|nr:DUF5693 family protein [Paenibacillus sp. OV219]SEN63534.1 hypothetical protein SAMN05518847_103371 [Paenibacillus sp. OV219]